MLGIIEVYNILFIIEIEVWGHVDYYRNWSNLSFGIIEIEVCVKRSIIEIEVIGSITFSYYRNWSILLDKLL